MVGAKNFVSAGLYFYKHLRNSPKSLISVCQQRQHLKEVFGISQVPMYFYNKRSLKKGEHI